MVVVVAAERVELGVGVVVPPRPSPLGIELPHNIVACPDVATCVDGATMMVFVIPHNFLAPIVPKMEGKFAKGAIGCSLIKGIEFEKEGDMKPILISDLLQDEMKKSDGAPVVDMSVLMGANVANEVAKGDFAEATIGCTKPENGLKWCKLFNTKDFAVQAVTDVAGAELCGARESAEIGRDSAEIGRDRPRFSRDWPRFSRDSVEIGRDSAEIGRDSDEIQTRSGRDWPRLAEIGRDWPSCGSAAESTLRAGGCDRRVFTHAQL